MRKSTTFVSVLLTTFMLAMLVSVIADYRDVLSSTIKLGEATPTAEATQPEARAMDQPVSMPIATTAPIMDPNQAAALAAQIMGKDLLSIESALFNNATAYKVTFTTGDLVYMGLDGQILSIVQATTTPVVVVVQPPQKVKKKGGGGNGGSNSGGDDDGGGDDDDD